MKVSNKVFVVTGGGNGIGRALVLELLRRGAKVAAVDIREESLDETAALANAGDRLATLVGDITDREAMAALPSQVIDALGAVDGLIHNAGIIQPFKTVEELDYETIERVIDINLYGTIHVDKAFLPVLKTRPEAHLANVSSMGGFLPVPGQALYGATKAGVKLLTEGLYAELLDTNVNVSTIFPGQVGTNITAHSGVEAPVSEEEAGKYKVSSPDEVARIILDGIEDDKFHIYAGKSSRMMNILTRLAPRRATHIIQRQMKSLLSR
jgi:NAD(P)-dependent dehydrogenase (short-subunit alcohol dehydrogenase family)